jgi:hypothetical protein
VKAPAPAPLAGSVSLHSARGTPRGNAPYDKPPLGHANRPGRGGGSADGARATPVFGPETFATSRHRTLSPTLSIRRPTSQPARVLNLADLQGVDHVAEPMMERRRLAKTWPTNWSTRFCPGRKRRLALAIDTSRHRPCTREGQHVQRMPYLVTQSLNDPASRRAGDSMRAFCLTNR